MLTDNRIRVSRMSEVSDVISRLLHREANGMTLKSREYIDLDNIERKIGMVQSFKTLSTEDKSAALFKGIEQFVYTSQQLWIIDNINLNLEQSKQVLTGGKMRWKN